MTAFITREHDYAIRITSFLAGYYPEGKKSVTEISRLIAIPRPVTAKLVHLLKHAGILTTSRGRYGGVSLSRNPRYLSFFDILKAIGFNFALNECVINPQICPLIFTCKIHQFFITKQESLVEEFKAAKIADFAFDENVLSMKSGKNFGT